MESKLAGIAALVAVLAVGMAVKGGSGAVVKYDFTVTQGFLSPDCSKKAIFLVNGVYPGPDINVTQGDTVLITLRNELFSESVTIHWHGIKQTRTPFMDGVPMMTQCPILTGNSFTYNFTVDQVGTFWWHSHYAIQKANGLYGLMVVRPKPSAIPESTLLRYDKELKPMLLNDWWHATPLVQEVGLKQRLPDAFIWVGDPQSLLINGKGKFNCSAAATGDCLTCNTSSPDCGYSVFEVEQGKRYRVRLVNVGSLSYLNYIIQGHNFTVVQADGTYTDPVNLANLNINGGQSYSIVFTANKPIGNYWITTHVRHRANGPTGAAILRYKGAAAVNPPGAIPKVFPAWNDTVYSVTQERMIVTRKEYREQIPPATRELILVGTQGRHDGYLHWAMNNNSFIPPGTPPLIEQYYGINPIVDDGSYDKPKVTWNYTNPLPQEGISVNCKEKSIVYKTPVNTVIQIVFQNSIALNNLSEQHPWHLHGHDFWVLGWGNGTYNSATSPKSFNLVNPIKRNTVTLYPRTWLAIRFKADNPGLWALHCHIVFHHAMGMQVAIAVGLDKLPPLPRNFPTCGNITTDVIRSRFSRQTGHHAPGVGHHSRNL